MSNSNQDDQTLPKALEVDPAGTPIGGMRGEGTPTGDQVPKGKRETVLNGRPVTVAEESGIVAAETGAKR